MTLLVTLLLLATAGTALVLQNALMLEGGQTFKALPSPHPSTQRGPVPSTQTMAPSPMPRMPQASPGRLLPQGGGTGTDGTI